MSHPTDPARRRHAHQRGASLRQLRFDDRAGQNFYRERYFVGAALILCGWLMLFLSWSAWGRWLLPLGDVAGIGG